MARVEHVRTPEGAARYHLPIGTVITAGEGETFTQAAKRLHDAITQMGAKAPDEHMSSQIAPVLSKMSEHLAKSNVGAKIKPKIRHQTLSQETGKGLHQTGSEPSWMDDTARTLRSRQTQHRAQVKSEGWYNKIINGNGYNDDDDGDGYTDTSQDDNFAAQFWMAYQTPSEYGIINRILRTGKTEQGRTKAEMQHYAKKMFDEAGTTTTQPIALYRALRSQRDGDPNQIDWAKELKPGTVFEDDGMVSTTAQPDMAQGWLPLQGKSNFDAPGTTKPNDVVMEIHVPSGTRIVGGTTEFIETMLPPGSKFKIISSQVRKAAAADPLDSTDTVIRKFPYTHVIAELQ